MSIQDQELEKFLHSDPMPDFGDAANRVWHRLEVRGFSPLTGRARGLSPERLLSGFGISVQGLAAVAAIAVVVGAALLFMSVGNGSTLADGSYVLGDEQLETASMSVEDILRLLAEGREAPPVTIQLPNTGPFERRGAPALRIGGTEMSGTSQDTP